MKILPDSLRCHVARSASGVIDVIPGTVDQVFPDRSKRHKRAILTLGAPVGAGALAFNEPSVLFVLVPLWMWQAWRLGNCSHCVDSDNWNPMEDGGEEEEGTLSS